MNSEAFRTKPKDNTGLLGCRFAWLGRIFTIPTIIALVLFLADAIRLFRHAMWRDELQAFMIAAHSPSLTALFQQLKYENHPSLWYLLLWLVSRLSSDPVSMQVLHLTLAGATWLLVLKASPFTSLERVLLLLSYFLFWEYFVVSRSYVLVALLGFLFAAVRRKRRPDDPLLWLLLGLMSNTSIFGTIWSMASAAVLGLQTIFGSARRKESPPKILHRLLVSVALYLVLLALAIYTMLPASDHSSAVAERLVAPSANALFRIERLYLLSVPLGAFVPLTLDVFASTFALLLNNGKTIPNFWNPNPLVELLTFAGVALLRPLPVILIFGFPLLAFYAVSRKVAATAEYALVYASIIAFAFLFNFAGNSRHQGLLFIIFVAGIWTSWTGSQRLVPKTVFRTLLMINAVAGLLTLSSEMLPFSNSKAAASWIEQNNFAGSYLVGSKDSEVSAVSAYLHRPIFYLECECRGTFLVWNSQRALALSDTAFDTQVMKALEGHDDTLLILSYPISASAFDKIILNHSISLLKAFDQPTAGAHDEIYWIYRIRRSS